MITVTKPSIPDKKRLYGYIDRALNSRWLTNDGPLVCELKERLEDYLGVNNLLLVANGTLGLLVSLKIAGCEKVLTTPFSFPATSAAPVWSNISVCYGDICSRTYNLLPPRRVNVDRVDGILATHVYGNPCDLEGMDRLSREWCVPVLYDAAHAFGVEVDGRSVLLFGDMSILSFHATKLFHCVEGGAIRFGKEEDYLAAREMINFGYNSKGGLNSVGINAKMNELEAAMGLAVLDEIDSILDGYRSCYELYDELLDEELIRQSVPNNVSYNFSYFSIRFPDGDCLDQAVKLLNEENIFPRQYFSPSLDELEIFGCHDPCDISRDIAAKILCLPIYADLPEGSIRQICEIVNKVIQTQRTK